MKMKKIFGILLTLAMIIGLLPMMGLMPWSMMTAYAGTDTYTNLIPTGTDNDDALNRKKVSFNGKKWYIIKDDSSSATTGTLTLLAAESFGNMDFDKHNPYSNAYSTSYVKEYLDKVVDGMAGNPDFSGVASAINTVSVKGSDRDIAVSVKLYLLSSDEANALPENVQKFTYEWWLRSPGPPGTLGDGYVRFVMSIGGISWNGQYIGSGAIAVRPALQLNLSSVIFTSESNTFTAKQTATITKAPTAKILTYTGSAQELVTAGTAAGGTMQYALGTDDKTTPTSGWSTSIPKGTDAGTYYVWYKVVGDELHLDTTPVCIPVTIVGGKVTYVVALVDNGVHEIGDQKDCRITVRSEPDGSKAYDNYQNTRMDAQVMPNGSHTAEKGSLIVTLKADYLDTLAIGKHKATINFKDGSVDVDITIKEGYVVPKTSDSANPMLWLGLMLLGLLTTGVILVTGKMRNIRK